MTASVRVKKLSFSDVLEQADNSFIKLFNMALLPKLEEKRIVPRGLEKSLRKKSEAQRIPLLLAYMRKMKPERFIDFLRILEQNSRQEENEETRKKTRRLMVNMSACVKDMFTYGGEKEEAVIQSFLDTSDYYNQLQSGTVTKQKLETLQKSIAGVKIAQTSSPVSLPPFHPPPGFMSDPLARKFGRDGGTLYSPIHGIEVIIPPDSPPQGVDEFSLSFHVYPRGPFILPDDVISCSPTVWFSLQPYFQFVKDVTVRIPHSARVSDDIDISVYRTSASSHGQKEPPYILSEKVADCEYGWYNTVIHVQHFSPFKNGAERKSDQCAKTVHKTQPHSFKHTAKNSVATNLKSLSTQKSSSFEKDHLDELTVNTSCVCAKTKPQDSPHTLNKQPAAGVVGTPTLVQAQCIPSHSVNRYCIGREMPRDRTKTPWDERFYIVHSHPSNIWQQITKLANKSDVILSSPKPFHFVNSSLQFTCQEVSDGWLVEPTDGEEITIDDLEFLSTVLKGSNLADAIQTGFYPSTITYRIDSNHSTFCSPRSLKCRIEVTGANRQLKYMLTSSAACHSNRGPTPLTTPTDLYDANSQLVQELTSRDWGKVCLDPRIDDHLSLITDVSIQIPDPETLSKMLRIDEVQFERITYDHKGCAEQVFQLVYAWVCKHQPTISDLCAALRMPGIILVPSEGVVIDECTSQTLPLKEQRLSLNDPLLLELYPFLQTSWRFVGRFLGLSEDKLTAIAHESMECREQAFQMLREWYTKKGNEATYGRLYTAVRRLWNCESTRPDIHNTYCWFKTYMYTF